MLDPLSYLRFIFDDLSERMYDGALGHGVDVQCQSNTGVENFTCVEKLIPEKGNCDYRYGVMYRLL